MMKNIHVHSTKPRIELFGAEIDPLTMGETLACVDGIIERRQLVQHVVINVAKLVMMQDDKELRQVINSCGLINADGQGVVWGAKILGKNIPERVAGIDLFVEIVKRASSRGYRLYFLGAKQEVVEKVINIFTTQYPNLPVAGFRNGYFDKSQEEKIADDIAQSKADVLFVAMSSPQKELFLNKYMKKMQVPFVMGVGGSFDVVACVTKRAPVWMQKAGLEWFYRFLCEPRRMWKRYLVTNWIFAGMMMKAILFKKNS